MATREAASASRGKRAQLSGSATDFEHLAAALFCLAEKVPARMTVRQALAWAVVAFHHARGGSLTMTSLIEITDGVVGSSIKKTIQAFFEPSDDFVDALGWIERVGDLKDQRVKHLRLTPAGIGVANEIMDALKVGRLEP